MSGLLPALELGLTDLSARTHGTTHDLDESTRTVAGVAELQKTSLNGGITHSLGRPTPGVATMNPLLNLASLVHEERAMLRQNWGWYVGLGALFALLGIIGLIFVGIATLFTVVLVGWCFLIGGIAEVVNTILRKGWSGFLLDFLAGTITAIAGLLILLHPIGGASVLTILIGLVFLVGGIFRLAAGIAMKNPYAGWFILQGVVELLLGIFVLAEWPNSSLWVIGTLVSVDLLIDGLRLISFGMAVKKLPEIGSDAERMHTSPVAPPG